MHNIYMFCACSNGNLVGFFPSGNLLIFRKSYNIFFCQIFKGFGMYDMMITPMDPL